MENLISSIIIAVIQGITEWLPISSSGHLVVFQKLLSYEASLMFDVALHFGTLMAVFVYFGKDIIDILEDFLKFRTKSPNFRLAILLIIASIPAAIIGYFFESYFESAFSSLAVVSAGFAITSAILLIASLDFKGTKKRKENLTIFQALFIGCAQALALFPGISRSGSTISAGLLSKLTEKDAIKFSFLLAIPAIFGASLVTIGNQTLPGNLIWATLVSFLVGLGSIHFLLKVILASKKNLRWFALYCLILAIVIAIYLITK